MDGEEPPPLGPPTQTTLQGLCQTPASPPVVTPAAHHSRPGNHNRNPKTDLRGTAPEPGLDTRSSQEGNRSSHQAVGWKAATKLHHGCRQAVWEETDGKRVKGPAAAVLADAQASGGVLKRCCDGKAGGVREGWRRRQVHKNMIPVGTVKKHY